MKLVTISSKRQITIPKDLLESLGLEAGDKAVLQRQKAYLSVKPVGKSIVEQTAGSLSKYIHPSKLGKSLKETQQKRALEDLILKYSDVKKFQKLYEP